MALVQLGFGIHDIRGKVGGSVFAGTRSGLVLKNKTRKKQTGDNLGYLIRNYMSANNYSWSQLTDTQRTSWESFQQIIRTNQRRNSGLTITAKELFIKYNQYRLLYELSPLLNINFDFLSAVPVTFDVNINLGALILEASRSMVPTEEFIVMSITMPVRATLNNPGSRFRFLVFPTTTAQIYDISTVYTYVFGVLPVSGQTIFFKAKILLIPAPVETFMETVKKSLI